MVDYQTVPGPRPHQKRIQALCMVRAMLIAEQRMLALNQLMALIIIIQMVFIYTAGLLIQLVVATVLSLAGLLITAGAPCRSFFPTLSR